MSPGDRAQGAAVVCERTSEAAPAMKTYLAQRGITGARWYDPVAVSSLDKAVRERRFDQVVFVDMGSLLDAIWDEEIIFDAWLENGVQIDLVHPPEMTLESVTGRVYRNWRDWRRRHRRRQSMAGAIISAIVLGLCFLINAVVP